MWWVAKGDIAAAQAAVPGLAAQAARPLSDNHIVFESGERVYQFAHSRWTSRNLVKEKYVLDELRGRLSCRIPAVERFDTRPVHMIEDRIPGARLTPPAFRTLPDQARNRLIDGMAGFLRELHGQPYSAFPIADKNHGRHILQRVRSHVDTPPAPDPPRDLAADAREALRALGKTDDEAGGPTLLHGDFSLANCLVDPDSGALSGVVDFSDSWIGDPHWDFARIRHGVGDAAFLRLVETYRRPGGRTLSIERIMALERVGMAARILGRRDRGRGGDGHLAGRLKAWRPIRAGRRP